MPNAPYKRSHRNIHKTVVARAQRLMRAQPWLMTDAERCRTVQVFVEKCLKSYGHEVDLRVRSGHLSDNLLGYCAEPAPIQEDALDSSTPAYLLTLAPHHSTPAVFTALRQMQRMLSGEDGWGEDEQNVAWANALLFTASPVTFRKLARRGRVIGVRPIDTFSVEDADLLESRGYVREDGTLLNHWTPETLAGLRDDAAGVEGALDDFEEDVDEAEAEHYDAEQETAAILADPETMEALQEAEAEASPALTAPFEAPESPQGALDDANYGGPPPTPAEAPQSHQDDLDGMNRDQVRAEARNLGIHNVSSHNRGVLVAMIREARRGANAEAIERTA